MSDEILGAEVAIGLAAVAVLGYFVYSSDLFKNKEAVGQGGGGALGNLANNVLEVGSSSESYTSAAQQIVTHPLDSLKSIFGISPPSATLQSSVTTAIPSPVPSGSKLTWTGTFGKFAFALGFSGIMQAVSAQLQNNYQIIVEAEDDTLGLTGIEGGNVTLHISTKMDRASAEDIRGNIADTFAANNVSVQSSSIVVDSLAPVTTLFGPSSISGSAGVPSGAGGGY